MAKKGGSSSKISSWAFLIGVLLAVVLGALGQLTEPWMVWLLVIIGLVVGFLNITESEVDSFLMAGAVLLIASAFGQDVMGRVSMLNGILEAILVLFVPATIIVAVKHAFSLARN